MSTLTENSKISAWCCYLTPLGLIIAFFINLEERHFFANFHIRQSLGIQTLFYATGALLALVPVENAVFAAYGFFLFFAILLGYGFVTALQGKTIPVPILGKLFQYVFGFIK